MFGVGNGVGNGATVSVESRATFGSEAKAVVPNGFAPPKLHELAEIVPSPGTAPVPVSPAGCRSATSAPSCVFESEFSIVPMPALPKLPIQGPGKSYVTPGGRSTLAACAGLARGKRDSCAVSRFSLYIPAGNDDYPFAIGEPMGRIVVEGSWSYGRTCPPRDTTADGLSWLIRVIDASPLIKWTCDEISNDDAGLRRDRELRDPFGAACVLYFGCRATRPNGTRQHERRSKRHA